MSHYKYSHKEIDCEYNIVSYLVFVTFKIDCFDLDQYINRQAVIQINMSKVFLGQI